MSLKGSLRGSILSRGVAGGGGSAPAPDNPPSILSFTLDDMTLDTGVEGTFSWTKSGTQTSGLLDPGDGSGNYTLTTQSSQPHTYDAEGVYDATLTLTGPGGTSTPATVDDIIVTAAGGGSVSFKSWGLVSDVTETQTNLSGGTKADAPVSWIAQFHLGAVPGTGHSLALSIDTGSGYSTVPTTDWQIDSRNYYPDGSLRSGIVRCYGPASWSNGASVTWKLTRSTGGSLPSESGSATSAHITGATDVNINLSGVRRLGPNFDTTQGDHTYTTLTGSLNYAMGLTQATKIQTGPMFSRWRVHAPFRNGSNSDAYLWWAAYVDVWYDTDGTTVLHRFIDPIQNNGWATKAIGDYSGRALAYKATITDGGSTLIDFTETVSFSSANINTTSKDITVGKSLNATRLQPWIALYVKSGGSYPTGITGGKLYMTMPQSTAAVAPGGAGVGDNMRNATLALFNLGYWNRDVGQRVNVTTTGGAWEAETWIKSAHYQVNMLRDVDGEALCITGTNPSGIVPTWTRAEKIYRMQAGQIINSDLDDGAAPAYQRGNRYYHPGGVTYTRYSLDTAGGIFQEGYQIGELGAWTWDVIQDMTSLQEHKTLKRAACEYISGYLNCGWWEGSTNSGTGAEYNEMVCFNNGSDKNGTAYSGLGTPRPGATTSGQSRTGNSKLEGMGGESFLSSDKREWTTTNGGSDGTHASQAASRAFEIYAGSPWFPELSIGAYLNARSTAVNGALTTNGAATTGVVSDDDLAFIGLNSRLDGTRYYGIVGSGFNNIGTEGKRTWIGQAGYMKCAAYNPDNTPLGPFIQDVLEDNVNFVGATYASPRFGDRARIVGPLVSLEYGSAASSRGWCQTWQTVRIASQGLYLMKMAGIENESALKFWTAMCRMIWGAPIGGGAQIPQRQVGDFGPGIQLFDRPQTAATNNADTRNLLVHFLDDAATTSDASTVAEFILNAVRLGTDGETFSITSIAGTGTTADPYRDFENGDRVMFTVVAGESPALPTGISAATWYWTYNKGGTTANPTYFLSSTPGPSYTKVTWTGGANIDIDRNFNSAILTKPAGSGASSRYGGGYYNEFTRNTMHPVTAALTMFGTETGLSTANSNIEQLQTDLLADQSYSLSDPNDAFYTALAKTKAYT